MSKAPRDHALALIKAGVSTVPYAGGAIASLISDYIQTATERSIESSLAHLTHRVDDLQGRLDGRATLPRRKARRSKGADGAGFRKGETDKIPFCKRDLLWFISVKTRERIVRIFSILFAVNLCLRVALGLVQHLAGVSTGQQLQSEAVEWEVARKQRSEHARQLTKPFTATLQKKVDQDTANHDQG